MRHYIFCTYLSPVYHSTVQYSVNKGFYYSVIAISYSDEDAHAPYRTYLSAQRFLWTTKRARKTEPATAKHNKATKARPAPSIVLLTTNRLLRRSTQQHPLHVHILHYANADLRDSSPDLDWSPYFWGTGLEWWWFGLDLDLDLLFRDLYTGLVTRKHKIQIKYRVGHNKRHQRGLFRRTENSFRQFWWFLAPEITAHCTRWGTERETQLPQR